jgi:hypothetical protein
MRGIVMIKFIMGLILLSSFSYAQVNSTLEINIANSIDGILGDTVNEGDMTVEVKRLRKKPVMNCTFSNHRVQSQGLAKCNVTLSVKTDFGNKCEQTCFLIYVYNLSSFEVVSRVENLVQSCLEDLSYGCD